jgi:predicted dehydrogenase
MGEVDHLSGFIDTLHHQIEGEDVAVAALKFKSGALGTLSAGTALFPGEPESITLYGTLGNVVFSGGKIITSTVVSIQEELNATVVDPGSGASDPMAISDQFHIATIVDFMNVVQQGLTPKVNIDQARKSVALINAIYESKGNKVKFN